MAIVRNVTPDVLHLFTADAPPVNAGGEVTVRDERFVGRAWPKSTWEVVEPPVLDGYEDASTDDAWLWAEPAPEPEETAADQGIEQYVPHTDPEPDATPED